jgi:hypothetical protein
VARDCAARVGKVDKQTCGFAADIRAFGDSLCHRLQEKPIHLSFLQVQPP